MKAEPGNEHRWLQQLVGDWTYEAGSPPATGQTNERCGGSEQVRMLGDLWVLCEGRGEMPGGGLASTLMTIGYDPSRGRFVGTWIGSMMTHLWVYEGSLDAAGRVLTLETEGPDFSGQTKLVRYRDVVEIRSHDERALNSYLHTDDGHWQHFMTATYRRRPGTH